MNLKALFLIISVLVVLPNVHTSSIDATSTSTKADFGGIGLPLDIFLEPGNYTLIKVKLLENRTYIFHLYGEFVFLEADLDMYILGEKNNTLANSLNDPGEEEKIIFTPVKTGFYTVKIINNNITSRIAASAKLLILERGKVGKQRNPWVSNITLNGGNKTHPGKLNESTYAILLNVENISKKKLIIEVNQSGDAKIFAAIVEYTRNLSKLYYDPITGNYIIKEKTSTDELFKLSFTPGLRNLETVNDTHVVLFIQSLRGETNLTIKIYITENTEYKIYLYATLGVIMVSTLIILASLYMEDKIFSIGTQKPIKH